MDVPPDNTFYSYVRCLSCQGIVGGYPCGGPGEPCSGTYYRPGNNVTRGQTSKIVTLAAGFADVVPSSQQTFEDVPPGSTFWLYVEQLAGRGIIGGYSCGGPFEPCVAPTNRPYFRPNNNVTRGQLSKIVSGAAGYTETPTGQTFEDVPPGSTFYLWVERLSSRGIISGYPCGGVGEPCVPPTNRPYFRPNNNATRGQMSKIAASTFVLAWGIVSSPNGETGYGGFGGVAVVNTLDIWAVGYTFDSGAARTLTAHWNGTNWSVVPSPNVGASHNILNSIAVVSASDVWAVGYYNTSGADQTLILHWNGTGWSVVPSPNTGASQNYLLGVAAVNDHDIWAVGFSDAVTGPRTLTLHWDGMIWSLVPSPIGGSSANRLYSVAAVNDHDVWAVGYSDAGIGPQTLAIRWNGTNWSVVPSPNSGASINVLQDVAVGGPGDAWAVGYIDTGSASQTLTLHWDGTRWQVVSSPNGEGIHNTLWGVTTVSASDVWAVGYSETGSIGSPSRTLALHWDGLAWRVVSSPNGGAYINYLLSVVAGSHDDVWAVGDYDNTTTQTLVEHYAQACP